MTNMNAPRSAPGDIENDGLLNLLRVLNRETRAVYNRPTTMNRAEYDTREIKIVRTNLNGVRMSSCSDVAIRRISPAPKMQPVIIATINISFKRIMRLTYANSRNIR